MATVDELLGLTSSVAITVDSDLRTINIPSSISTIGVASDDEVLRLPFRIPRYYGEFDLSKFTVRINYLNAKKEGDAYYVKDLAIDGEDLTFSWLVGRQAVSYKGNVTFNICMFISNSDGVITKEFNTTIASLPVLEGLETSEAVIQEYADVLEQWRYELFEQSDAGVVNISEATANALSRIQSESNIQKNAVTAEGDSQVAKVTAVAQEAKDALSAVEAIVAGNEAYTKYESDVRYSPVIEQSAEGSDILIQDSAGSPVLDIVIEGDSEQAYYSGKNLMPYTTVTGTGNIAVNVSLPAGDYTISAVVTSADTDDAQSLLLFTYEDGELSAGLLFSRNARASRHIILSKPVKNALLYAATDFTNSKEDTFTWKDIQIESGDTATDWEPFVGGMPSPSPDYPQEIVNVVNPSVKVLGKNLLRAQDVYHGANIYAEITYDNRNCIRYTSGVTIKNSFDVFKSNTQYTFSFEACSVNVNGATTGNHGLTIWYTDGTSGNILIPIESTWHKYKLTSASGKSIAYVGVAVMEYRSYVYLDVDTFQCEEGTEATPYEPYTEQTLTVSTDGLCGIGDVKDYVDFEKGVLVKKIGKVVVDGNVGTIGYCPETTTEWKGFFIQNYQTNVNEGSYVLCDKFIYSTDSIWNGTSGYKTSIGKDGALYLNVKKTDASTWTELKTWLAENTPTVYYVLATPIETPLDPVDIAAYKALHTNRGVTTVISDCDMKIKYATDPKTYIDNKFAELQAALSSLVTSGEDDAK